MADAARPAEARGEFDRARTANGRHGGNTVDDAYAKARDIAAGGQGLLSAL